MTRIPADWAVPAHRNPATVTPVLVTRVEHTRGEGVKDDPMRRVTGWYLPDGTLLLEEDPTLGPWVPERSGLGR